MCGLILAPDSFPVESIEQAMLAMDYRGADGFDGIVQRGGWTLGHVRLAIQTDRLTGRQPFKGHKSYLAFVGEIFGQHSEEEMLFKALSTPYLLGFHELDGFWALAEISDSRARVLTDHLGIKPLYHWVEYNIVCSEIEPMFKLVSPPPLDEIYLGNCIRFGFDYSGRTPYQGIVQVPPGTCLTFDVLNYQTPFPYWDWHYVPRSNKSLRQIIEDAIFIRANYSKRNVSLLLSGGLDSSIIYYVLKREGYKIDTYSVENGESEYLPEGVKVLPVLVPPTYQDAVEKMQCPVDLGSLFPQIQLAEALTEQGVYVCISGDGADEVFGGYRRAAEYDSQWSDVFCELPYYHLPRLDRIMMRSTIELRSPFLAPSVVAYGLDLPYEERTSKQALKKAFADILPIRILERAKHPLKSKPVLENAIQHRIKLVGAFREHYNKISL